MIKETLHWLTSQNFSAVEICLMAIILTGCYYWYNKTKTTKTKKVEPKHKCIESDCLQKVFNSLEKRDANIKKILEEIIKQNDTINVLLTEIKNNNQILKLNLLQGVSDESKHQVLQILEGK